MSEDQMLPDASPGIPSGGIRRVNNMPVYIVGTLIAVFLLIMVLVAMDRAKNQNRSAEQQQVKAGTTTMFAKELAGDRKDGIIQAQAGAAPAGPDLAAAGQPGSIPIARPVNLDLPPAPPTSQGNFVQGQGQGQGSRSAGDEEAARLHMMKLQKFDEAAKARTSIQVGVARSPGSAPGAGAAPSRAPASNDETLARLAAVRQQIEAATRDDPTAAYQARVQQLQQLQLLQAGAAGSAGGAGVGRGGGAAPQLVQANAARNDVSNYAGAGQGDRWRLESQPEAPRTPYELRSGFVIPALLISGINSELPGTIMAQVSQDVYDTPTGKWKLIPQGSRLQGSYASEVVYGQSRVLVAWQRIIFPDGKAMDIGAMPGADSAGYSGFRDQVNNHYLRTFGSAFLMSAVTAGIAKSQPQSTPFGSPSFESALSQAVGQQLGQVTAQLIAKNLNISPTLEIRPGYRFNVIVTKDMTFSKPYQPFDY
ncbi:conjugal transfer protein TrbI [Massilia psychrophila]|uniref:Conjugal transfer protein TrbI n=1 Tax=Massilia psychrophila TaxID=1603353 RepID=A0A2G8SZL8_9BURK|nr:conjugal transfer protein TrbI [Massilia psychrophila]